MTQYDVTWNQSDDAVGLTNLRCRQVYVWLVTSDKKIILVSKDGKQWQFPGGKPEENESREQTAVREVREETNIDITDEQPNLNFFGYYVVRELDSAEEPYTQLRYLLNLPASSEELILHSGQEDAIQDQKDVIQFVRAVTLSEALELIPWLESSPEFQTVKPLLV